MFFSELPCANLPCLESMNISWFSEKPGGSHLTLPPSLSTPPTICQFHETIATRMLDVGVEMNIYLCKASVIVTLEIQPWHAQLVNLIFDFRFLSINVLPAEKVLSLFDH